MFPARAVEDGMRADVIEAKSQGYPQLPPAMLTPAHQRAYIEEWGLPLEDTIGSVAAVERLVALSQRVEDYNQDSALLFLGIGAGMLALLGLSAALFSRASNNLYALGHEWSAVPPAWAAAGFLIPVLNFVIPWIVVDQVWRAARATGGGAWRASRPSVIVAVWALVLIFSTVFNPFTISWFVQRTNIDRWISYLEWNSMALLWLPVPVVFTAVLALLVTWWQHRMYVRLAAAGEGQNAEAQRRGDAEARTH